MPELVNPATITVDENQMYVTQDVTVLIYSLRDFKLIKKFGKKGEGPREFLMAFGTPVNIDVQTGQLMVISSYKLSYFTKQGEYKREEKTPASLLSNRYVRKIGNKFVGSSINLNSRKENERIKIVYRIFDAGFNPIKQLYKTEQGYEGPKSKIPFNPIYFTLLEPSVYAYDNKIFIAHYGPNEKGMIYVFDTNGQKLYDITPPYDNVIFTEKDKQAYINTHVTQPAKRWYERNKSIYKYGDFFPMRQSFQVVDNKIYIQTFKKSSGGEKTQFLVLDLKGKMLHNIMLPLKYEDAYNPYRFTIKNGRIYQLVEHPEDEEWELHIENLNLN
ncbi:MAG: hypothetical protein GY940_35975 [bacterium]|nr:hypothetical protein [bacterium]